MSRKKTAGRGHGWPCRRKVAGTGTEQSRFHSGKQVVTISCDADRDAISADRIDVLARAVILVAGMDLPEADRATVLARVLAAAGKNEVGSASLSQERRRYEKSPLYGPGRAWFSVMRGVGYSPSRQGKYWDWPSTEPGEVDPCEQPAERSLSLIHI